MDFQYTEEQQLLADSINRLIDRDYDFETRQKIVASPEGYSADLWNSMAEMGLMSLPFSSDDGGYGGGTTDMIAVMEAIGAGLVVEPYVSTMLAGRFVARAGSEAQREAVVPGVIDGSMKLAFAHTERDSRYDLSHVECRAEGGASGGWTLSGEKRIVAHAPIADRLLVSARTAGAATDRQG
ncbi:MAG: acyl-CoA dehydrogenase family protein, partial [Gammaproteobacteria bacterium]